MKMKINDDSRVIKIRLNLYDEEGNTFCFRDGLIIVETTLDTLEKDLRAVYEEEKSWIEKEEHHLSIEFGEDRDLFLDIDGADWSLEKYGPPIVYADNEEEEVSDYVYLKIVTAIFNLEGFI